MGGVTSEGEKRKKRNKAWGSVMKAWSSLRWQANQLSLCVDTVCLWDGAKRQKNDSLEEERKTVIMGCVRLVRQPEKLSHKSQESSLLYGTCSGGEKTSLQSSVGIHSLPAQLDWFLGYLLWRFSSSTFLLAELYCPALKKKQIKNLQGSLHHWPLTGTLRELIFHGSICPGPRFLSKCILFM